MGVGNEKFSNSKISASGCCFAFAGFFTNCRMALLGKVLLIKKVFNLANASLSFFIETYFPLTFMIFVMIAMSKIHFS